MIRKSEIYLCFLALAIGFMPAYGSAEDRVDHYEAEVIKDADDALKVMNAKLANVDEILKNRAVTDKDQSASMEEIHQISYTLEAAIDKMIAEKAYDADRLAAIDEGVQAIHYASENGEADKVSAWYTKLLAAVKNLDGDAVKKVIQKPAPKTEHLIVIKDHKFTPEVLYVPAGQKIKLIVDNQDATPEEFESDDLRREKIIAGNSKATVYVGPMKPGKYHFFGEFNLATANGYIIAE